MNRNQGQTTTLPTEAIPTPERVPARGPYLFHEHTHDGIALCPECGGEGEMEVTGRPRGVWNNYVGTFEPDWHLITCETCGGEGRMVVPRCDRCGLVPSEDYQVARADRCECTEDEIEAWTLAGAGPEVSTAAAAIKDYCRLYTPGGARIEARTDAMWAARIRSVASLIGDPHEPGASESVLTRVLGALAEGVES